MKLLYIFICSVFLNLIVINSGFSQGMNNEKLEKILYVMSDSTQGGNGMWEFTIKGMPMMCITDEANNRMRIISPVREMKDVTDDELKESLKANFHSALDVRYSISSEIMWVAFIHPFAELTKNQVIDAITQVFNANITFGSTYSSTGLVFPKNEEEDESKKKKKKPKTSKT